MTTTTSVEERRKDYLVHFKFFEPIERLFYKTLRAKYPEMTIADIVVCRAVYIDIKSISGGEYKNVVDRMLRGIWTLYTIPREEWARYVLENKHICLKPEHKCDSLEEAEAIIQRNIEKRGLEEIEGHIMFETEQAIEEAIGLACTRGYIKYAYGEPKVRGCDRGGGDMMIITLPNPTIILREDIVKTLDKVTDESVQNTEYVSDEELQIHEQEQAEFDRRLNTGLS